MAESRAIRPAKNELEHIAEGLRPLAVLVADLHEDPANARKGHAVDRIAASLKQYGQRKPIVVNRAQGGKVEAGNGTLAAAKALGWTHIAAVFVDDDPATAAAYGIADNRVGEFSQWDADVLGDLVATVDGLYIGFTADELAAFALPGDGEWTDAFGGLPNEDRAPFQQMTFTLHDTQVEVVKRAIAAAQKGRDFDGSPNGNGNGNALWWVCDQFLGAGNGRG